MENRKARGKHGNIEFFTGMKDTMFIETWPSTGPPWPDDTVDNVYSPVYVCRRVTREVEVGDHVDPVEVHPPRHDVGGHNHL